MENKIAEFIGIMLGDGSIGHYKCQAGDKIKDQYVVKVTLDSRNKAYAQHVNNLFGEILNIFPRISYKKNENTLEIRTFHKKVFKYLINEIGLKISPKWNKMEIPKKYLKKEFYGFILKGLFDTDGCLSLFNNNGQIYPRIEIKICPSPAQNQFVEIIKKLGFRHTIQKLDKEKIRIRISGIKELKKWFEIVGSSNPIHLKKYEKILQE